MKGLLAFDQMNDVIFMKFDSALERHLYNLAKKQGLVSDQSNELSDPIEENASSQSCSGQNVNYSSHITPNVIIQIFSPLLTSQYIMESQFHNGYSSVNCEDGFRITFKSFSSHQFLCISSKDETESQACRRLNIFIKLINLLYGLAFNALKVEFLSGSNARPKLLSSLVHKWEKLQSEEQSFLVEAVERVLINKSLSAVCIKLLEHVIETMKRSLIAPYSSSHAFLLIGPKLLSFYSSRNAYSLVPSDLLLLTILANTAHSQDKKLKHVGITASLQLSTDSLRSDKSSYSHYDHKPDFSRFDRFKRRASFIRNIYKQQPKDYTLRKVSRHMDISYHLLFLQSPNGLLVPHIVYNIRISSGIVLVIVNETGKSALSKSIFKSMDILSKIRSDSRTKASVTMVNEFESSLNHIFTYINKCKLNSDCQRIVKTIALVWEQLQKLNFLEFIRYSGFSSIDTKMEVAVSSFYDLLRDLYKVLIYTPELVYENFVPTSVQNDLVYLQKEIKLKLSDYIDYLIVKSAQNITMTTYAQDYPGLLHFIYIDRKNNFILAPCISKTSIKSIPENDHDMDPISISHDKVWRIVKFTQKQIHLGHTSIMWKDESHYCTYFLWFEDKMGNSLATKKRSINHSQLSLPGILNGDFYKSFTKECFPGEPVGNIHCYELLCVHVGTTSVAFVINFCRRLAAQLWELSGNAASPLTSS